MEPKHLDHMNCIHKHGNHTCMLPRLCMQDKALAPDQLHLSSVGQKVFFDSVLQLLDKSTDLSPAVLGAQQQPQQPKVDTAGGGGAGGSGAGAATATSDAAPAAKKAAAWS
jgi:hypothetical protein